jgi:FAD/FMN-containing dehydrogenase
MKLQGWGRYPRINTTRFMLQDEEGLKKYLNENNGVIAFGNGRSYGDSPLSEKIVYCPPYNYFLDFNPETGILKCRSGVMLAEILECFIPRGWFLSITPGTKLITVGGAIAADVHGKNHHVCGCFSECVKSMRIMLPDGSITHCRKGDELFQATCGGMGLTGIILDAEIGLKKINSAFISQTTIKTANLRETFAAFNEYAASPYSVAWIDCLAKGPDSGRSILMTGDFANDGNLNYKPKMKLNIPCNFPAFALNKISVSSFNKLFYACAPTGVSQQKVDFNKFFYPLDAINNWNRIYGANGFTQYQFILPGLDCHEGLQEILTTIAGSGKGSFLAVLKLYGKTNDNYLSFPLEGYSLALDFKIEPELFSLLDRLDEIVLRHKGRIYLAKDARISREAFEQGYPSIELFRSFRRQHGMTDKFSSLQSRRLGL